MQQYLEAEILHALSRIRPTDTVLELGCGTGRIVRRLAAVAGRVVGIDTAAESIARARETVHAPNCVFCAVEEGRVKAAGGKVQRPKMSIGEYGFITLAVDTEGNMIGLLSLKSKQIAPALRRPSRFEPA